MSQIIAFGKFKNQEIENVFNDNVEYFKWHFMENKSFVKKSNLYEYLSLKFQDINPEYTLSFGKYKDNTLKEIQMKDYQYIEWLRNQDLKSFAELKHQLTLIE